MVFRKRENSPHSFASWQPALWQHSDDSSFHPCVFLLPPNSPLPQLSWPILKQDSYHFYHHPDSSLIRENSSESTPQKDFLTIRAIQQWGSVRFEWSLFLCRLYLKKLGRGEGAITNVRGICFCFSNTHAISFGSSIMIHWGAWSKSFEYRLARTVSKGPSSPLATGRARPLLSWPGLPFLIGHMSGFELLVVTGAPGRAEFLTNSPNYLLPLPVFLSLVPLFSFWNVAFPHILPSSEFWYVSIKCSFCCICVKTPGLSKQ